VALLSRFRSRAIVHTTIADPALDRPAVRSRRLRRGRARTLAAADALAVLAAYVATYLVADQVAPPAVDAPSSLLVVLAPAALAVVLATFAMYRLYEREASRLGSGTFVEVGGVFHALLAASLALLLAGQLLLRFDGARVFSPAEAVVFLAAALVLVPCARGAVRSWLLPRVMEPRRALVVGRGEATDRLERKLGSHPEYGVVVVGRCDASDDPAAVADALDAHWVMFGEPPAGDPVERVAALLDGGVQVSVVPQQADVFTSNATLDDVEGMPVVSLPQLRLSPSALVVKRAFDLVLGTLIALLATPVLAVAAVAILLDDRGPVLYRQARRGRNGEVFEILKFRTMVVGADRLRAEVADLNEVDGPLFKVRRDPRITRVGRFLRRTSIDELPQIWNVLRGDMSLVGPRPFVLHEADQIQGWGRRRLQLTPGMTGLWQVLGRNDIPYDEMLKLDYLYVTGWSVWWDLRILCETVPAVLRRKGAY
jgi:exopolysaccharide biosynthesis polyprenyl glycosylphosphotransferase